MAYGHHRGGEPALGIHPARRDDTALRRRHVLDQPRGGLYRSVANDARVRRRAARHPPFPGAGRYRQEPGLRRERPTPRDGDRAPDRARASRDGRAPPVRQSIIPEVDRRPHLARERADAGSALGTRRAPRIHGALQMERRRHRLLGQPLDLASGADRHLRFGLRSPALPEPPPPGDVPVGVDGRPSVALKGEPIRSVETELTAAAG